MTTNTAQRPKVDLSLIPIKLDELRTVEDLVERRKPILTEHLVRWHLRHRDTNGLALACVRVGKWVLISEPRYEAWLGSRAGE